MITNLKGVKALERMAEAKEQLAASEKQMYASFLESLKGNGKPTASGKKSPGPSAKTSKGQPKSKEM